MTEKEKLLVINLLTEIIEAFREEMPEDVESILILSNKKGFHAISATIPEAEAFDLLKEFIEAREKLSQN